MKKDLGPLEELQIRYNKRFASKGLIVNDVVEISQATMAENGRGDQFGVAIQKDVNNVAVSSLKIEDVISIILEKKDNLNYRALWG